MSKDFRALLKDEDKKTNESKSLLTTLFRKMLSDLDITPSRWNDLCNKYFRSGFSSVRKNSRDVGNARNNLSRLVAADNISYNNFIRSIKILRPLKIKLTLELTWRNGLVTKHSAESGNELSVLDKIEAKEELNKDTE